MLGSDNTTVVIGQGLGPDLRVPVPFVMARRRGTVAHFVALYEPSSAAPSIRSFRETSPGVFTIVTASSTDKIRISPGQTPFVR